MKKKSPISVRKAVEMVYEELPDTFYIMFFVERVRARIGRPFCMDDTIKRRLREARADKLEFNYRCIDNELALYQKIKYEQTT